MRPLRARYVVERNVTAVRRFWLVLVAGGVEPALYLLAIGLGLGGLVGEVALADGSTVPYAAFVAPALLATSAMNGAVYESTNIFFKTRYAKTYVAALATPLEPRDIVIGEILWSQARGLVYGIAFLLLAVALGLLSPAAAIAVLPGAVLTGLAFAALAVAGITFMRSVLDFDVIDLVTLPLFLFSATFFPLDVYPAWVRPLVQLSPLYHGTELLRALAVGPVRPLPMLAHALVLAACAAGGIWLAGRRLRGLLAQ